MIFAKAYTFILLTLALFNAYGQDKNEVAIRKCFEKYQEAMQEKNGKAALKCVDSRTIEYYSSVLDHAIYSDSAEVASLDLMKMLMVLSIRSKGVEEVIDLQNDKFFIYVVERGLVNENQIMEDGLGSIQIEGDKAVAGLISEGKALGMNISIRREGKKWKIDLTSIFSQIVSVLNEALKDKNMNKMDFVRLSLESYENGIPDNSIWRAYKQRPETTQNDE